VLDFKKKAITMYDWLYKKSLQKTYNCIKKKILRHEIVRIYTFDDINEYLYENMFYKWPNVSFNASDVV